MKLTWILLSFALLKRANLAYAVKGRFNGAAAVEDQTRRRRLGKDKKSPKAPKKIEKAEQADKQEKKCRETKIVRLYEDMHSDAFVVKSATQDVGTMDYVNIPIYELDDDAAGAQIGMYQGSITYLPQGDCIGSYMWSFDYNDEIKAYETQLFTPLTCLGLANPVSGGTGDAVGTSGEMYLCGNVLNQGNEETDEAIGEILCFVTCTM